MILPNPKQPKDGRQLQVLAICRISTTNQDEKSLEDQEQLYRDWLRRNGVDAFKMEVIKSQVSGEILDRDDLRAAEQFVESGSYDLVIAEDLSRIARRTFAVGFCELCEDHDTRLVAINDNVDTASDDWRFGSVFATLRHEMYNRDTAKRISRSQRNRFLQGGQVGTVPYGYLKPDGCSNDAELQKDPDAEAVYDEWFRKLEDGASFAEVADWLNANGIEPGKYCTKDRWDVALVSNVTRNPLLKGNREFGKRVSRRVNKTGRRKKVRAPENDVLRREVPHLAFIDPVRYDHVIHLLAERNAKHSRRQANGHDVRANVSKKRTVWPGQHLYCGVCGRMFVYFGKAEQAHLYCGGSREYACWNASAINGPMAAKKMAEAIFEAIQDKQEFDERLRTAIERAESTFGVQSQSESTNVKKRLGEIERALNNIAKAIGELGGSDTLLSELRQLEVEKRELQYKQKELLDRKQRQPKLPSMDEIRQMALESFQRLAIDSPEFDRQMKKLISKIVVFPYMLIDGGQIVHRAQFELDLSYFAKDLARLPEAEQCLKTSLLVDLFEPPQREFYRDRVVAMRTSGLEQREVAAELGIDQAAVQRASRLQRMMDAAGRTDPYIPVKEPPTRNTRMKRHLHKRYRFNPSPGFPMDWPTD